MSAAAPDPTEAADELVAKCILVYERDGDGGVDLLLAEHPELAAAARARFVELRDGGGLDFGREHGLAWYAIWGFGVITHESRVLLNTLGGAIQSA